MDLGFCNLLQTDVPLLGRVELPEALLSLLSSPDSLLEETLLVLIPLIQFDQPLLPHPEERDTGGE